MVVSTNPEFFTDLGLEDVNCGVYGGSELGGRWWGNGKTVKSYNPATGKVWQSLRKVFFSFI